MQNNHLAQEISAIISKRVQNISQLISCKEKIYATDAIINH